MSSLRGAHVLVVEDEAILSGKLEAMLLDLGCVVAGTADKLDDALQIARTSDFDVALLDVNLGGKRVDPVADAIRARGTPIIFVTGYGKTAASGWCWKNLTTRRLWNGYLTKPWVLGVRTPSARCRPVVSLTTSIICSRSFRPT